MATTNELDVATAEQAAAAPAPVLEPQKGGSYLRNPDGTLTLVERTEGAAPTTESET